MKTKIAVVLAVFVLFAGITLTADAHMGEGPASGEITAGEFSEVQDIMAKMMSGQDLTESEWQEMSRFMDDHHGASFGFDPMMTGGNSSMMQGAPFAGGMMGAGGSSFVYWLIVLTTIVWLFVGVLLSVFLIKRLNS